MFYRRFFVKLQSGLLLKDRVVPLPRASKNLSFVGHGSRSARIDSRYTCNFHQVGILMIRFMKRHVTERKPAASPALGHLERTLMEILWTQGEGSVHDVIDKLRRPLAYTTVMTTLDRLFKKGFLNRRKPERAFLYAPRLSRQEWDRKRADDLVSGFLTGPRPSSELLISSLVEAVGQHDEALLDELEKKIRMRRRELERGGKP